MSLFVQNKRAEITKIQFSSLNTNFDYSIIRESQKRSKHIKLLIGKRKLTV